MNEYEKKHIRENGISRKKGIIELLEFLEIQDIPKGVATSTRYKSAIQKLELTGLLKYFEHITGGDQVSQGKPAPDIFLAAAEKMKVDPDNCLVLEDSEPGIKAALAAGMLPIMIPDLKQPSPLIKEKIHKILPDHFHVIETLKSLI